MTASISQRASPVQQTQETSAWEIGKEAAMTALPFLTLYKPLSFPVAIGTGTLRLGISAFELVHAVKEGDLEEILSEFVKTTVAVVSLAGTIFAHPIGLVISTSYDLIAELPVLVEHLRAGKYKEAFQSGLKILGHCLYLAVVLQGGPELMICYFALQVMTGLFEAHQEWSEGKYIAALGHALMSMIRGGQLVGQVKALQLKWEIQRLLSDPVYVGKLAEKWQFPSDHLPVGAKVGDNRIISWNILNGNYMKWITEHDTQGLSGSLITELHAQKSEKYPGLTKRDELVMVYLLQIINDPSHNGRLFLGLQECSPEFVKTLSQLLPENMGMVLSEKTLKSIDHNILIYNKLNFTFLENESAIVCAFPRSSPTKTMMDIMFLDNATQEKTRIMNVHLPGDPLNPGTFDFANYLLSHLRSDCTTIGMGDMNFTEKEMQQAFEVEGGKLNISSPFANLVKYNTNVGANTLEAKSIDHIWVNTPLPCESLTPDEVLPGLQSTVDLLSANRQEYLKKWYRAEHFRAQQVLQEGRQALV